MRAWARISRSQRPIGDLLMDQAVLAGVGNVYRAEVLFRHRMHPLRPGRTLRVGQWRAMWDDLVVLMAEDIPESQYGFRATPVTRSIAETLVHIAWLGRSDRVIHEELHLG